MADLTRRQLRDDKIARTLLRLKHSLRADDEIYEYREAVKRALLNGEEVTLSPSLLDFSDEV